MNKFSRYEKDIDELVKQGGKLVLALQKLCTPDRIAESNIPPDELKKLPDFHSDYQRWYSEACALVAQLLPERLEDFRAYYAPKGVRKSIEYSNYTISDALKNLQVTSFGDQVIADTSSAINSVYQQFNIVKGLQGRFKSTLYDIKTLVHADVLDDELHAAEVLNKNGFERGAGAVAGVVLEAHLASVCERHAVTLRKKDPSIADLNEALKAANVLDIVNWRYIQHLGDLRNKCDHKKQTDPTRDEVNELIEGVRRITKTVL